MARKAKIGYWASRQAYCIWINGVQHTLAQGPDDEPDGPTYRAALKRYDEIKAVATAGSAGDANTLRVVCELYLRHLTTTKKNPATIEFRHSFLKHACDGGLGESTIKELTQFSVYQLCERLRVNSGRKAADDKVTWKWTDGSVRNLMHSLNAALNWGKRCGLITKNPLTGIDVPEARSRGRECVLTPEEHELLLRAAPPHLMNLLLALWQSGARPGELINAQGGNWDNRRGAIVYQPKNRLKDGERSHKTGRKGKERVIRFTGEVLTNLRSQVESDPAGYLFRTSGRKCPGNKKPLGRWTIRYLGERLRRLCRKVELGRIIPPYAYRHSFATRMLEAGMSIENLALLMGTSAEKIRAHYSHVDTNDDYLRQEFEKFTAKAEGGTQTPREEPPTVLPFAGGKG